MFGRGVRVIWGVATTCFLLVTLLVLGCSPVDPLVGSWRQVGTVGADGTDQPLRGTEAVVIELQPGGRAVVFWDEFLYPGGQPWTWSAVDGTLEFEDNPGGKMRTSFNLDYRLEGDRLVMDWAYSRSRLILERQ